jgi:hypothetical protein
MNITIHLNEVATALAEKDLQNNYKDICSVNGELTYYDISEDCIYYNRLAQDQFNKLYDYYWNLLDDYSLEKFEYENG